MTDVLVVGAGPTGLVLALWLARAGVAVRIIDRLDGPQQFSRALGVQARTLEFYRMLGFAEKAVSVGTVVQRVSVRVGQRVVAQVPLGEIGAGQSRYPFVLFLPQDVHEDLLRGQLQRAGLSIEWGTELTSLLQTPDGVTARLSQGGRQTEVDVGYLCGADGAGSTVRKALDIGFPGHTDGKLFYVADADLEAGAGVPSLELCVNRYGMGAVMPSRHSNAVRYLGLVPSELEHESELSLEKVAAPILEQTGHAVRRVNWFSVYRVHHRVAERFQSGRVFLLGDAGHVHSPAGAQGMNTGIGDAINLAWKLAAVIERGASPALLDTYEPERIRFARALVKGTDHAFSLISGRGWVGRLIREVLVPHVAARIMRLRMAQQLMFRTISQTQITYRDGPLSSSRGGRLAVGDRLPWLQLAEEDNHAALDGTWQIHVYGEAHCQQPPDLPIKRFAFTPQAAASGLVPNGVYLVRPDGHIASINVGVDAASNSVAAYRDMMGIAKGQAVDVPPDAPSSPSGGANASPPVPWKS